MEWQEIDKQIMASLDIEFYKKLDFLEEIVFDLKYIRLLKVYQIVGEVGYSDRTVRRCVKSIRDKFTEYNNAKEV